MKKQQQGLTFIGLVIVGAILVFLGVVGAQVVPTLIEYQAIQKAVQKASGGATVSEVRNIFDKATQIDDIHSITGKDLAIGKDGDRVVVSYAYSREIHLGGPAWLVLRYEGSSR